MTNVLSLRVVRPYATEEAFLAAEAWTVTTRSILLVDVEPQAEGAIARIELTLSTGASLIVAEGSVVRHLPATETRPAGLVVKFRRMSADSSEFVKRATARAAERSPFSSPLGSASLSTTPSIVLPRPAETVQPQARGSARPGGAPRAQSVSVIPQARRLSTVPPGSSTAAAPPTQSQSADSKTVHGDDAMARLRQRAAQSPITVPPDRETILARLKKP